jgi:hypothetical protein
MFQKGPICPSRRCAYTFRNMKILQPRMMIAPSILLLFMSSALGGAAPSATSSPLASKKLIEFGWDEPSTAFMRAHILPMEKTPFDGCVFHVEYPKGGGGVGNFTWECWGTNTFTLKELQNALDDLKATRFVRFTNNFLRFNTSPARLDWFDDFGPILANAELAARIAREGKCAGLLFDTEHYDGPLFNYHKQRDARSKSFAEYTSQARKRGREVMEAFQQGYPDLTIFLTFAYSLPWAQSGGITNKLAEVDYGLLAAFMDGLFAGATGKTKIVDGYESSYAYKQTSDFENAYKTMQESLLPMVVDADRYRKHSSIGFGLWMDLDWRKYGWNTNDFSKNFFSPEIFGASVRTALQRSDEYVWIYTETPRWWSEPAGTPQNLPRAYEKAVREAAAQR